MSLSYSFRVITEIDGVGRVMHVVAALVSDDTRARMTSEGLENESGTTFATFQFPADGALVRYSEAMMQAKSGPVMVGNIWIRLRRGLRFADLTDEDVAGGVDRSCSRVLAAAATADPQLRPQWPSWEQRWVALDRKFYDSLGNERRVPLPTNRLSARRNFSEPLLQNSPF